MALFSVDKNKIGNQSELKKKSRNQNPVKMVSAIKKIIINDFRQFKNQEISIADRITFFTGLNGTGKSTLLAILGNCCALNGEKPLIKTSFKADIKEIITGSLKNDPSKSNVLSIEFVDIDGQTIFSVPFRRTWQEKDTRFRLIPKHEWGESKLGYPVIYLGLSRLYPLGECDYKQSLTNHNAVRKYLNDNKIDKEWFDATYKSILSMSTEIEEIEVTKHPDIKHKMFVGIQNEKYDSMNNSAGQDNLGQILLSILSFKAVKNDIIKKEKKWYGGLLLIDELDATLHPAAQNRLLNVLYVEAVKLNLQVTVTTHSLSLVKFFFDTRKFHSNNDNKLFYITTKNKELEIKEKATYEEIELDMLVKDSADVIYDPINVITEDDEARWFLMEILPEYIKRQINLVQTKYGCDFLAQFNLITYPSLESSLIILDGDYTPKYKENKINLLVLPGGNSPEGIIYDYLKGLPSDHLLLNNNYSLNKKTLEEYGPFSDKYKTKKTNREKYKQWFIDNRDILTRLNVISYWRENNKDEIELFVDGMNKRLDIIREKIKK